jgi:hypothetical protein
MRHNRQRTAGGGQWPSIEMHQPDTRRTSPLSGDASFTAGRLLPAAS